MAKQNNPKDAPDQAAVKADLYSIVKRRRRTVKSYLDENKITTKKQLDVFLKNLKKHYVLSKQFLKECNACVVVEPKSTETAVKSNAETASPPTEKKTTKKRTKKSS